MSDIVNISMRTFEEKLRDFGDLLRSIDKLDDQKKQLWKEIYENALTDRQNAFKMFQLTIQMVGENSTQMAVHGKTIEKFLEKMSRANDQLLKLAELIAKANENNDQPINPDDMYSKINT